MEPSSVTLDLAAPVAALRAHLRACAALDRDERIIGWASWFERTVVRPLVVGGVLTDEHLDSGRSAAADVDAAAEEITDVTVVLAEAAAEGCRPEVLEACAGALQLVRMVGAASAGGPDGDSRLERLRTALAATSAGSAGRVTVAHDGPYLAVGPAVEAMVTWLGVPIDPPPVVALCRCGHSAAKPWCDGSHAEVGFSGAKRTDRVPDHRDVYEARQFEITDNRGLCAHSGRCTDALPTAFRVGTEPFVAAAGARADDILRAIQACPSGALGAALEGRRVPDLADTHRVPQIEVSKDGPYRLTGGVEVVDPDGSPVERPAGFSPEHCSLCRCGHSTNKPFCSGAHWNADFHDPLPSEDPTLFEWAGGYPALLRMTTLFYERYVAADDLLAPLFARMEPDHPERVASWLSEVFGGPDLYSRHYGGYARMISQHIGKHLTEPQRARWIALLARSADEANLPTDPEFRAAFAAYLEWGTRIAVENSADGARPPEGMPIPRWWWVCNATPAARPSSVPSAEPENVPEVTSPDDDEIPSFERHVKGLFRPRDRGSMRFVFDLWSHDDVTTHSQAILARLHDGSMPCDGPWPTEQIAVFERWAVGGHQP